MTIYDSLVFFGAMFPVQAKPDQNGRWAKVPALRRMTGDNRSPYPVQADRPDVAAAQIKHWRGKGVHAYGGAPVTAQLCALDVDDEDAYLLLEGMGMDLGGPHVRTPRGGWHFYFRLPVGGGPEVTRSRNGLWRGVDYRCDGTFFIVFPGSIFPDADGEPKIYTMVGSLLDAPEMPAVLKERLEKTASPVHVARDAQYLQPENVSPSEEEWEAVLEKLAGLKTCKGGGRALDNYGAWIKVGLVLRSYSRPVEDFLRLCWDGEDPEKMREFYAGLKPAGQVTFGSLIFLLRENGYPDLKPGRPQPEKTIVTVEPCEVTPVTEATPGEYYPDLIHRKNQPPKIEDTPANFQTLLKRYGIRLWLDEMSGRKRASISGLDQGDKPFGYYRSKIYNLAGQDRMPRTWLDTYINAEVNENTRHPVKDYLDGLPEWDGVTRLPEFYLTVDSKRGFPLALKELYLRKFLLQCIAAIYDPQFMQRGALVFQGAQSLGKTSWFRKLVQVENSEFVGTEFTLKNPDQNKDEAMKLLRHWISELGELDRTNRKSDVGAIKAFLTAKYDEYRKPYAEDVERYKRRTVIVGTVNNEEFLIDDTGSTRFWIIPVEKFNEWDFDIDQLWAEVKTLYFAGVKEKKEALYWLSQDEEKERETQNENHQVMGAWADLVSKYYPQYDGRPQSEMYFKHAQDIYREISDREGSDRGGVIGDGRVVREINAAVRKLGYVSGKDLSGRRRGFFLPPILG